MSDNSNPAAASGAKRSAGVRFFIVGLLVLLMFIPLFFAAEVINGRKFYSQSTLASVSKEWGGRQMLSGPQMVIPVERDVTVTRTRPKRDPISGKIQYNPVTGVELQDTYEEIVTERGTPVYLYPDLFDAKLQSGTQIRSRGIFQVPVYNAQAGVDFTFDPEAAEDTLADNERMLWDEAELRVTVSENRALRGAATLTADGRALDLEPLQGRSGVQAVLGDPRDVAAYRLDMGFNGAERLSLAPVGRDSRVEIVSDWPHPSFDGAFLPDASEITDTGFRAQWTIPHLARSLPQASREDFERTARQQFGFGVSYVRPNDFYQKAFRAARYGVLFIALTFLTILLVEQGSGRQAHPVQYVFVGLAQTVFVLLMVSYAEHIGFGPAYALSAGATIGLLTIYGAVGLKLGKGTWVLGGMLGILYAVLFMILRSSDYALLAGSTLAFVALALTMLATRNETWSSGPRPPRAKSGIWKAALGKAPDPKPSAQQSPA